MRLLVVPLCLFIGVSAAAFALSKLALAEPSARKVFSDAVVLGDAYRGQVVYSQSCAACHGATGEGGVGPKLQANQISLEAAKAQIDSGSGAMPAQLVTGRQEEDLLAYLATIFATQP